jgi:hypothetical protein
MNKKINILLIILITGLGIGSVQSRTTSNDMVVTQIQNQNKDYGSPIKQWAGDAKCKLKRFFGSNCYT